MARTTGVVPNRLSGEAAPNTLGGVGAAGPPGLASAPGGGRMAAISRVPARRPGRRLFMALVIGAIVAYVVILVLSPA
jgi:hypothetical protein